METATKTNKSASKRVNLTKTEFVCLQVLLGDKGSEPNIIVSSDSKNDYKCFFFRAKDVPESVIAKGFFYLTEKIHLAKKVIGLRTIYSIDKANKPSIDKAEKLLVIGKKIFLS